MSVALVRKLYDINIQYYRSVAAAVYRYGTMRWEEDATGKKI